MKLLVFLLMFFIIGALIIISNNELALLDDENLLEFSELYVLWLEKVYFNARNLTGQVIGLDWVPE